MKVGDYARSSEGDFGKIVRINNSHDIELEYSWVSYDEEDLKSSPNIIDLIEVGDYVNGEYVIGFGKFEYDDGTEERTSLTLDKNCQCLQKDIKSIVTKECFESMEYKVKE